MAAGCVRHPRSAGAFVPPIVVSTAQVLVAIDTQRLDAAAYPFALAGAALALDDLDERSRRTAGIFFIAGQLPWLGEYSSLIDLPLRGVEILLVGGAAVAGLFPLPGARRASPQGPMNSPIAAAATRRGRRRRSGPADAHQPSLALAFAQDEQLPLDRPIHRDPRLLVRDALVVHVEAAALHQPCRGARR